MIIKYYVLNTVVEQEWSKQVLKGQWELHRENAYLN